MKNNPVRLVVVVVGTLSSGFIYARPLAPIASVCSDILQTGIRNNYYLYTNNSVFDMYRDRICAVKASTYQTFLEYADSLNINVPVAKVMLGLSGTSQQQSREFQKHYAAFCSAQYSQTKYQNLFRINQSTISTSLTNTWKACVTQYFATWQQTFRKGITISATPQDDYREFTIFVRRRSSQSKPWQITSIAPSEAQCKLDGDAVGKKTEPKINENEIQLDCTKNANTAISFSLSSSSDGTSNVVTIPGAPSKIAELQIANNDLRFQLMQQSQDLKQEEQNLASLEAALANWHSLPSGTLEVPFNFNDDASHFCPNGYYLVGLQVPPGARSGPHYAKGAINALIGYCRKLP